MPVAHSNKSAAWLRLIETYARTCNTHWLKITKKSYGYYITEFVFVFEIFAKQLSIFILLTTLGPGLVRFFIIYI